MSKLLSMFLTIVPQVIIIFYAFCRNGAGNSPLYVEQMYFDRWAKTKPAKSGKYPPSFLMGGNISGTIYFFAVFASFNAL